MKQRITEEQYNELTEPQKDIWYKWCLSKGYTMEKVYGTPGIVWPFIPDSILGFPSIGEMIEFLDENNYDWEFYWGSVKGRIEICDALWEAVKEIFKND